MPTIVFASSKGGVGKSTSALVLAQDLARRGFTVHLLDADPNNAIQLWNDITTSIPQNMNVISGLDENNIYETIEASSQTVNFVIVDLEGSANLAVSYAIGLADLVIIPMQASQLDAVEAAKIVRLIGRAGGTNGRNIPFAALFTRTSYIKSRTNKHIIQALSDNSIPKLKTEMTERDAFRALFTFGGFLDEFSADEVSSPEKAVANTTLLTDEVLLILKEARGHG